VSLWLISYRLCKNFTDKILLHRQVEERQPDDHIDHKHLCSFQPVRFPIPRRRGDERRRTQGDQLELVDSSVSGLPNIFNQSLSASLDDGNARRVGLLEQA